VIPKIVKECPIFSYVLDYGSNVPENIGNNELIFTHVSWKMSRVLWVVDLMLKTCFYSNRSYWLVFMQSSFFTGVECL